MSPCSTSSAATPTAGLLAHPAEDCRRRRTAGRLDPRVAQRQRPGAGHRRPRAGQDLPDRRCDRPAYTGRVMKIFEKRTEAVLGVFRILQDGTFRIEPVERRQPELVVDTEFQNGAQERRPGRGRAGASLGRFGLPRAKVLAVLGSLTSEKAVSMIAIHAHDIPHIFPAAVIAEAEAVKPATMVDREDWRDLPLVTIDPADAKDHDDAVFAEPDLGREEPGRRDRHRRDRRCRGLCPPRHGARPRGAEARQFGLFPRPRRADAARAHLQRSLLAARRRRTARRWPSA